MAEAGLAGRPIALAIADPAIAGPCIELAGDAHRHFAAAARLMDGLPREQVRAPRLMAAAYQPLLHRLEARGWEAPRRRLGKRKRDLLGAVLRYGIV